MQMNSIRPGLAGDVSEHRFRLALLACALVLAAVLTVFYSTVGFVPIWAGPAVSAAS
jgi:ABC-type Fe3+-siderophore transport system permease subunit